MIKRICQILSFNTQSFTLNGIQYPIGLFEWIHSKNAQKIALQKINKNRTLYIEIHPDIINHHNSISPKNSILEKSLQNLHLHTQNMLSKTATAPIHIIPISFSTWYWIKTHKNWLTKLIYLSCLIVMIIFTLTNRYFTHILSNQTHALQTIKKTTIQWNNHHHAILKKKALANHSQIYQNILHIWPHLNTLIYLQTTPKTLSGTAILQYHQLQTLESKLAQFNTFKLSILNNDTAQKQVTLQFILNRKKAS